jgi:AcrR family transcriptional regulator
MAAGSPGRECGMTETTLSRADTRRLRLLSTSAEIFSRRGFRATSMKEIAAAVGMSKPTIYHYFNSKEELLVRLYSDVLDESLEAARETVAAAATPLDAIRDLIASRVAYTCRNQALLKVCFEEEHELPAELAQEVLRRRRAFEDFFGDALSEHLAAYPHLLPDMPPKIYVNMCLGAVNWCYKWYRRSGPATPEELGRQIAATLTAAIDVQ